MRLTYISHPEVAVDPTTPPPAWGLSARGIARATALGLRGPAGAAVRLIASPERKAQDCAVILGHHWGIGFETHPRTGEVDRSATGYVPPDKHDALADRLFAEPHLSADGWERAVDAQARMIAALAALRDTRDLIMIGHGAVGSFLWCALTGLPISRKADQPRQGCLWSFDLASGRPLLRWTAFEAVPDATFATLAARSPDC